MVAAEVEVAAAQVSAESRRNHYNILQYQQQKDQKQGEILLCCATFQKYVTSATTVVAVTNL
jgi:hypothetical protein